MVSSERLITSLYGQNEDKTPPHQYYRIRINCANNLPLLFGSMKMTSSAKEHVETPSEAPPEPHPAR